MPSMQAEGIKKVKVPADMTEQELNDAEAAASPMEKFRYSEERRKRAARVAPPPTPTGTGNTGVTVAIPRTRENTTNDFGVVQGSRPREEKVGRVTESNATASDVAAKSTLEANRAGAVAGLSTKPLSELQKMQADPNTGIAMKVQIAKEIERRKASGQ